MAPALQYELATPPSDAISALAFAPSSPTRLVAASWDKNVYLYDIQGGEGQGEIIRKFEHRAPVLDVCFGSGDDEAFSAGTDFRVMRINLESGEQQVMSKHSAPVRCVVYDPERDLLISASWDSTLNIHTPNTPQPPLTIPLPGKPHAISLSPTKLVVCMTSRLVTIYSLSSLLSAIPTANPPQPFQNRESSLKFLTRAVSCMPTDTGYATSSIEGRVAVEFFEDTPESQSRKYAFKCHRQPAPDASGDVVYPVNALQFHPVYGTFATGGGDGHVALWDAEAKRRMKQYQKFPESVAALAFSSNGKYLAVGTCPGFETGQEEYSGEGRTRIFVRELGDAEARPKGAK